MERPPQGNGGYLTEVDRIPPRFESPPRYLTRSARPRLLEAAVKAATERGYESLRISDITDPVGVQRQAFYAHFRDKRHCLCEAIDPKLAVIERMAAAASEDEAEWSAQIVKSVDEALYERFQSEEGTKGRLTSALRGLLAERRSLAAIKISDLVKAAHVPQGDFYKHFSGKKECFALLHERLLDEVDLELEELLGSTQECPAEHTGYEVPTLLRSLGEVLTSDPRRLELLVFGAAELPPTQGSEWIGSCAGSLRAMIAHVLIEHAPAIRVEPTLAAAAITEVVRSASVADEREEIPSRLASLAPQLPVHSAHQIGERELAA